MLLREITKSICSAISVSMQPQPISAACATIQARSRANERVTESSMKAPSACLNCSFMFIPAVMSPASDDRDLMQEDFGTEILKPREMLGDHVELHGVLAG